LLHAVTHIRACATLAHAAARHFTDDFVSKPKSELFAGKSWKTQRKIDFFPKQDESIELPEYLKRKKNDCLS